MADTDRITLIAGAEGTLEASEDGSTWHDVPYVGDISAAGGEATETDVPTRTAVGKIVGKPGVPTITVELGSFVPTLAIMRAIYAAGVAQHPLQWRMTSVGVVIFSASGSGNTVAIAADGTLTFAGDAPDLTEKRFAPGQVLQVGSTPTLYYIDTITAAGVVKVRPAPSSAVAATQPYQIVTPSLRLGPISAGIRSPGQFNWPQGGALARQLQLVPQTQLPEWQAVAV